MVDVLYINGVLLTEDTEIEYPEWAYHHHRSSGSIPHSCVGQRFRTYRRAVSFGEYLLIHPVWQLAKSDFAYDMKHGIVRVYYPNEDGTKEWIIPHNAK